MKIINFFVMPVCGEQAPPTVSMRRMCSLYAAGSYFDEQNVQSLCRRQLFRCADHAVFNLFKRRR